MFEYLKFVMNVDKIPMSGTSVGSNVIIQTEKPDANCFKCAFIYCNDKKKGRYDSNGTPEGGCCGHHEK